MCLCYEKVGLSYWQKQTESLVLEGTSFVAEYLLNRY